ncbi:hypothetical protein NUW54_g8132 [Trametes sanguinea]|uniref:Uncharacterized protein n=1 Tax=Trametes sanguinea TaxID=158606 RepID=A0ACC1PGS4_9APHY|nr:hypothetical protein NUW54_g8132 [Trametes sanguinea]
MNTARSFGPAVVTGFPYDSHWIYWLGPFLGSLLGSGFYTILKHIKYWRFNPGQDTVDFRESPGDPMNNVKDALCRGDTPRLKHLQFHDIPFLPANHFAALTDLSLSYYDSPIAWALDDLLGLLSRSPMLQKVRLDGLPCDLHLRQSTSISAVALAHLKSLEIGDCLGYLSPVPTLRLLLSHITLPPDASVRIYGVEACRVSGTVELTQTPDEWSTLDINMTFSTLTLVLSRPLSHATFSLQLNTGGTSTALLEQAVTGFIRDNANPYLRTVTISSQRGWSSWCDPRVLFSTLPGVEVLEVGECYLVPPLLDALRPLGAEASHPEARQLLCPNLSTLRLPPRPSSSSSAAPSPASLPPSPSRRVGHKVTVLEAMDTFHETPLGAGCRIPPNATKLFYRWGMEERLRKASVKSQGILFAQYDSGSVVGSHEWEEEVLEETGGDFLLMHYSDLRRILAESAEEHGATLRGGCQVVSIEPDTDRPYVTLATGEVITGDVVIGADGCHVPPYHCRRIILEALGQEDRETPTGMQLFNVLLPESALNQLEDKELVGQLRQTGKVFTWFGPGYGALGFPVKEPTTGEPLFTIYVYASRADQNMTIANAGREELLESLKG